MLKINDIFHSHQGEGTLSLVPMNFIRLQGCNLYPDYCCRYCDTGKAQNPKEIKEGFLMSTSEILKESTRVRVSGICWWYCITGGEPLLQSNGLLELVKAIKSSNAGHNARKIEIETNGTLPPPLWSLLVDSWVVDVKCPTSGVESVAWHKWVRLMRKCDQVKFVVSEESDLDFVKTWLLYNSSVSSEKLLSPVMPCEDSWLKKVIEFSLTENMRMSVQLHKLIGVK